MGEEVRAPITKAEIPCMVAYLSEDIQELRNEVREVRRFTIESYEKLDKCQVGGGPVPPTSKTLYEEA